MRSRLKKFISEIKQENARGRAIKEIEFLESEYIDYYEVKKGTRQLARDRGSAAALRKVYGLD